ncbi:MAG: PTS sugar transporter subunit IIA [Spirochaetia bacterium]|nr:PTS sugar transporter subunit IIA [Spirochaetia bacterium]
MRLSEILAPSSIKHGWPSNVKSLKKTKWSLFEAMIDLAIIESDKKDETLKQVKEREKSMTTGIGEGIAIPHASLHFLQEPVGSMVILPEGLDFDSIDQKKAQFILLILLPKKDFTSHIRTLASASRFLHNKTVREILIAENDSEKIYQVVSEYDKKT